MVYTIESGREDLTAVHHADSAKTTLTPESVSSSVIPKPSNGPTVEMETDIDLYHNQGYLLCRPFLWLMRLGGMFFLRTQAIILTQKGQNGQQVFVKGRILDETLVARWVNVERVSKAWSLLVLLINAVYAGKFLYSVVYGLRQLNFTQKDLGPIGAHCAFAVSIFMVITTQLIFLKNSLGSSGLFEFFCQWRYLHYRCAGNEDSCANFRKSFTFRRNVICVIVGIHLAAHIFSLAVGPAFLTSHGYQQLHSKVTEGFDGNNQALMALNFLGGFFLSFVDVVPPYFFYLIAELLTVDFEHLTHDLGNTVRSTKKHVDDNTGRNVEWFRSRHNGLCTLVEMADEIFSPWVLLILACCVLQILCNVYVAYAVSATWTFMTAATAGFWFATFFFQIYIVLRAGSRLTAYISHQILIFEIQLDLQLEHRIEECTHLRQELLGDNPASHLKTENLLLNHNR
ncbi:hypothetical protein RvY_03839 [Ramazzottius varieornatus]|uniref:Gustatory receptor n=1 Tax=Ramazzottius varieornatus TaxID=947166 RepID=A0A1D1UPG2_RAMVA|nr:hypothetical protein RvY_03839 [Ramazzottius varieornatus]